MTKSQADIVNNAVKAMVERQDAIAKAIFFGASIHEIECHEQAVYQMAITTWFSNSHVGQAGMDLIAYRLARGETVIPLDVQAWANELWDLITGDLFLRQQNIPGLAQIRPEQKAVWDKTATEVWRVFSESKKL